MKRKLLITLGDSFTEGVGCYDYSKPLFCEDVPDAPTQYQLDRFHNLGWPTRLGKKLNYDKVLNLGWGGSGHSAHIKLLFEKVIGQDFSEYDVLVVWLLTSSSRFSFYSHGHISQYGLYPDLPDHSIEYAYYNTIGDIEFDSILETIFYIRCLEQICENNSFNLLITSWVVSELKKIKNLYNSKYYMKEIGEPIAFLPSDEDGYKSKICGHPNELGYEKFSQNMFNSIKKFNSQLINTSKVDNFENIYNGRPIDWSHLNNDNNTKYLF